ncbi:hypothetical protein AB0E27_12745 [Streptomyces sparsogenes]|uniref:hypothetical protein n=1 Tax=Streptomyces sparsogenes TaxID=67365 RepID=UPI0033F23269
MEGFGAVPAETVLRGLVARRERTEPTLRVPAGSAVRRPGRGRRLPLRVLRRGRGTVERQGLATFAGTADYVRQVGLDAPVPLNWCSRLSREPSWCP